MIQDYNENLKRLLSFYPHIYLSVDDIVPKNIIRYTKYSNWFINTSIINLFKIYDGNVIGYVTIDISLAELDAHIEQLKRDTKLKEAMEIIYEK